MPVKSATTKSNKKAARSVKAEQHQTVRKVLYSPGYGGGWVSWYYGTREEKLFMLEYSLFVEFLEHGNKFPEGERELNEHPLVQRFKKDWDEMFPNKSSDYPFLGGLHQLEVHTTSADTLVQVKEYDGSESVVEQDMDNSWL